jgi:hypothetical protein
MRLYRAVSDAEFADLTASGTFALVPHSLEGKWLAETPADAETWRCLLGESLVIEIEVPDTNANRLFRIQRLDGIGPARYAELEDLKGATFRKVMP